MTASTNPGQPDQPQTGQLAAHDDALAAGQSAPALPLPSDLVDDVAFIRRLHDAWPAAPATALDPPTCDLTAATSAPAPQQLGRFRLLRPLGQGGFGIVYLAHDPALNRLVALKVPRPEALLTPEMRQRFLREAHLAAGLDHPHLVPVHEAGEVGPVCYIASAYVPGDNLAAWLAHRRDQPIDCRVAARLVSTLAEAIHHAHSRGVLHRDLKPANVLLQAASPGHPVADGWPADLGVPRVCDFGLARTLEGAGNETQTGAILGTPEYMAPEQAAGRTRDVGVATDVYALGVILYECLTGQTPYRGESGLALLQRVAAGSPPPPRKRRPDVPHDLETICLECLHTEPGARYDSALALARDLTAWLEGRPIQARRHSLTERFVLWARREPRLAVLSALSVLALLALPALGVWMWMRSAAQSEREQRLQYEFEAQERLAQVHEFYRLLSEIKERQVRREPGGTWKTLASLARAGTFPAAADNLADLRSLAAGCLGAVDLRVRHPLGEGFTAYLTAFSPDGKRLALVQGIGGGPLPMRVRFFDPATGKELAALSFPSNLTWQVVNRRAESATAVAFSTDGRWLAVGTRSGMVHTWDLREPAPRATSWQAHTHQVRCLAFAPDSGALFSLDDKVGLARWSCPQAAAGVGRVWPRAPLHNPHRIRDIAVLGGERLLFLRDDGRLCHSDGDHVLLATSTLNPTAAGLAISPDGRTLAVHERGALHLFDLQLGGEHARLPESDEYTADDGLAFSPDGRWLARVSSSTRTLRLWDVASGRLETTVFVPGGLNSVAFSPDGRSLAVTAEHQAFVYEFQGTGVLSVVAHQGGSVRDLAFTADGRGLVCLATLSHFHRPTTVTHWPLAAPFPLRPVLQGAWCGDPPDRAHRLALPPWGASVYFTRRNRLFAWDVATAGFTDLGRFDSHGGLCSDPAGGVWAACHHDLSQADPGQVARSVWTNSFLDRQAGLTFYSVSAGRQATLAGRRDGRVFLFRPGGRVPESSWPLCNSAVTAMALAPDEETALVGTERGKLFLVLVPSGKVIRELLSHDGPVTSVLARSDLLITGSHDRTVRLWSGEGLLLLTLPVEAPVRGLAISPDGAHLGVVVEGERAVRLWRLDRLADRLQALGLPPGIHPPAPVSPRPGWPPIPRPAPTSRHGLKTELFADHECGSKVAERFDSAIDFWPKEPNLSPDSALGPRGYSIRWTGWLRVPVAGAYHLHLLHQDGARLWLDGSLVLDAFDPGRHRSEVRLALGDRPHAVRLEFYRSAHTGENTGAHCSLRWRREGSEEFEVVPAEAFFHDRASAKRMTPAVRPSALASQATGNTSHVRVALDAAGYAYVAGTYRGHLNFGSPQARLTSSGRSNAFLARYSPEGKLLWARRLPSTGTVVNHGLAVTPAGEAHLTGFSNADIDIGPGKLLSVPGGCERAFVCKLDRDGRFLWAHLLGGGKSLNRGGDVAVDSHGSVCVTGIFSGAADFDPGPRTFSLQARGKRDLFVWKLDRDGRFLWAHRLGSEERCEGNGIAVDAANNIVVAGEVEANADSSWAEALSPRAVGVRDGLVLKLDPDGKLLWHRLFGGKDALVAFLRVALDSSGNVGLLGVLKGKVAFLVAGEVPVLDAKRRHIFLASLTSDGQPRWVRPTLSDHYSITALTFDRKDNLLVALRAEGRDVEALGVPDFVREGALLLTLRPADGLLAHLQRLGDNVQATGLAVDAGGNICAAGSFTGVLECDPEPGKARLTSRGKMDLFLMKRPPARAAR